jgi:phosphate-selective porin OprO/OprP
VSPGRFQVGWLAMGAAALLAGQALADDGPSTTTDANIARLETLLEAQQKKIEALEQQVAEASQADMNAARVEQMRQQIREILNEQEFRESLMPPSVQAGYEKGFYVKSSDEKFMLKMNGRFQFRWTYYATRDTNRYTSPGLRRTDRSGFDWSRLRFKFSGYAYTKNLTYLLELETGTGTELNTELHYAWVNYRAMDELQFKFGTFKLASTRTDFASSSVTQFPERPLMNAVFGLGHGTGIRIWGKLFKGKGEYYLDYVNVLNGPARASITTDEERATRGHDNNPGLVFRTVWSLLKGEVLHPEDEYGLAEEPSDMAFHTTPDWNAGFHYAYQEDWQNGTLRIPFARQTSYQPGGFGVTSSQGLQMHQFGVDSGFKYQGFSLTGEYAIRLLEVRDAAHAPYTPLYLFTGDAGTRSLQGAYVQAGYFLPIPGFERKLEVVGRIGGVSTLSGGEQGTWEYAGGLNYYIDGQRVKLQTDVTKVSEAPIASPKYSLANVNDDALIFRVQLQVAF